MGRIAIFSTLLLACAAWGVCLDAAAQTVQLPAQERFTANSTVMVPDGGSMNLGGISRASSGSSVKGTPVLPFRNRAFGSDVSASNVQVSAQIIDLEEMDAAVLGGAGYGSASGAPRGLPTGPGGVRAPLGLRPADSFSDRLATTQRDAAAAGMLRLRPEDLQPRVPGSEGGAGDVASPGTADTALNADLSFSGDLTRGGTPEQRRKLALDLARQGYREEKAGNKPAAVVSYRRAAALATGELKRKIEKRLAGIQLFEE